MSKPWICKQDGCDRWIVSKGLCRLHGGDTRPKYDNCPKWKITNDIIDGNGQRCQEKNCQISVRTKGFCSKHLNNTVCSFSGCTRAIYIKDHCYFHRNRATCNVDNCTKYVQPNGLCVDHGGKCNCEENCKKHTTPVVVHNEEYLCQQDNCNTVLKTKGFCSKHITFGNYINCCTYPGCVNIEISSGLCFKHGGKAKCKFNNCNKYFQHYGLCRAHNPNFHNIACKFYKCTNKVNTYGFCKKHNNMGFHENEVPTYIDITQYETTESESEL